MIPRTTRIFPIKEPLITEDKTVETEIPDSMPKELEG